MDRRPLHTVVENPEFQRRAAGRLSRREVDRLVDYIAANPDAGEPMAGTGGARKVRWAGRGKGKSGGIRVITFYSGPPVPVFLLAVFGKGEKSDISQAERNEMRKGLKDLVAKYMNK